MIDFKGIFTEVTADYNQDGIFAGVASTGVWAPMFTKMRNRLLADGATLEEQHAFRDAILHAIDSASGRDLNDDERTALRHILLTTHDGVARMYRPELAPKSQFLQHVKFSN